MAFIEEATELATGDDVADLLPLFPQWTAPEPAPAIVDADLYLAGGESLPAASELPGPALRIGSPLEDALLARIVARDERALAAMHDACAMRLHALVLRIVRRPCVAEEVVADVFWQVWREAARFDLARGSAMAWICTIARHRAIDALRHHHAAGRHTVALEEADTVGDDGVRADPGSALEARRRTLRVDTALRALAPVPRQVLAQAFLRGLTHEEIAERSGMALGTVKSHVRRSLSSLRAQFDGAGAAH